jgi:2-polyprenyl-6-methoxyphenol hydroxylase-like FAD-dependent oxidoreductase
LLLRFYNARMAQKFVDVCIRGAGIVGRALALMLARERLRVALVVPPAGAAVARTDVRAYALNAASARLLQELRVWPDEQQATAVRHMEVFGDGDSSVRFAADAHDLEALAWIVDVPALEQRLAQAVSYQPMIEVVSAPVPAPLTAICEGRASSTRQELGVEFDVQPYGQTALATRLLCERPHEQVARQWFSALGILAFLPLGGAQGQEVAVVWSAPPALAAQWQQAEAADFVEMLQSLSHNALGALQLQGARMIWPLQQAMAQRWCGVWRSEAAEGARGDSWVLLGDAAHNVHPLAGQGLNLGLADVATLAQLLAGRDDWRSTGDLKLLRRYERTRKAAMLPLGLAMDGIQQLFARPEGRVQMLRNWGMNQFERSSLLKRLAMRHAMGL